jgi:broad specificity phosphatase PhoE
MSIIFIRHGETLLNAARTIQPADTPLSPRGHSQAERVAARVHALKPAALLASDMPRAWQTAQAIGLSTGLTPIKTPLLWERNFGDLRGRPYDTLSFNAMEMIEAPMNGESMETFHQRVAEALAYAATLRASLDGPLIVVSHGLVIRALLENNIELGQHTVPERIGNTAITTISTQTPHRAELVNCTAHLQGTGLAEDDHSLSGG